MILMNLSEKKKGGEKGVWLIAGWRKKSSHRELYLFCNTDALEKELEPAFLKKCKLTSIN